MQPRAIVTGGTGALGTAVCRALLEAGYDTHAATIAHDPTPAAISGLDRLRVHVGDLTREVDAERIFQEVGGPLAAVVATVGGFIGGPLAEVTAGDIERLTALNLTATVLTLKHAHPRLKENPGGAACVLVAARGAHHGGPGAALYSATKAGVANLAVSAAQEWKDDRITVNAVLPSIFDTPRNRADLPDADYSRWPTPEEIAAVVRFLVSEDARIVSGGWIPVYGQA